MQNPPERVTWWSSVTAWARALVNPSTEMQVKQGADYSPGSQVSPDYAVENSVSAFAAFPWVRACVDAVSEDLAGCPWVVSVGEGKSAEVLDAHPVLDLLRAPTSWQTGEEWERQVWLFLLLTGNAFAVKAGPGSAPVSLPLMHPDRVRVSPTEWGAPGYYLLGEGGTDRYEPERVIHFRVSAWQDTTQSLLGEGLIRALHNDLEADLAASKLAARQSQRGRPDAIIRPKDGIGLWDDDVRKAVAAAYDQQIRRGGALVLSDALEAEFPTFTPRDLEFAEQRRLTRETVLAAFGVPPSRVGLPTANYATQAQQARTYWEGLQAKNRLVCARLTASLGRAFGGAPVTIGKSFAHVEALQEARDARLNRVKLWTDLGMAPAAAAAYEGFADAPDLSTEAPEAADPADVNDIPDEETAEEPVRAFRLLSPPALHLHNRLVVPRDEEGRSALWRSFLSSVHEPAEAALYAAAERDLARQGQALSAALDGVWPKRMARQANRRDIVTDIAEKLFAAQGPGLQSALREVVEAALRASFRQSAGYLGERYEYGPAMLDTSTQESIGALVKADANTRAQVQGLVDEGIREGWTIYEMQRAMVDLPAFAPTRARVVARTETTRAVNGGAQDAYSVATADGVVLRKQWLSARDLEVRFEHADLDGQTVDQGGRFVVHEGRYAGASARFPGDFAAAALVVNCRCTTIPVVEDP